MNFRILRETEPPRFPLTCPGKQYTFPVFLSSLESRNLLINYEFQMQEIVLELCTHLKLTFVHSESFRFCWKRVVEYMRHHAHEYARELCCDQISRIWILEASKHVAYFEAPVLGFCSNLRKFVRVLLVVSVQSRLPVEKKRILRPHPLGKHPLFFDPSPIMHIHWSSIRPSGRLLRLTRPNEFHLFFVPSQSNPTRSEP